MFALPIGIAVPNDSPVKSIKDLKGLRMPSQFTAQSTIVFVQDAVLATGGLSIADMKPFPVADYVKGMMALGDGKVDAALFGLGTGASQEVNVALASRGGLRFVPLTGTPEALAAMRKVFSSAYSKVYEPSPGLAGIIAPSLQMVYSAFLVTSTHTSADIVYKATKAIHGNKPMLEAASPTMKSFEPSAMDEDNVVAYHPGAERFYKEAGEWPPKKR
jgi:TRAP transporter TAXI family solute receptor